MMLADTCSLRQPWIETRENWAKKWIFILFRDSWSFLWLFSRRWKEHYLMAYIVDIFINERHECVVQYLIVCSSSSSSWWWWHDCLSDAKELIQENCIPDDIRPVFIDLDEEKTPLFFQSHSRVDMFYWLSVIYFWILIFEQQSTIVCYIFAK